MNVSEARRILAVDEAADAHELKAAYRAQLKRWHPDRFASDPEAHPVAVRRTQAITDAWRTLDALHDHARAPWTYPEWTRRPIHRIENWPRTFWLIIGLFLAVSLIINALYG